MGEGVLALMAMAIVAPFASVFVFGTLGWLIGAGLETIIRSQLIAAVCMLFVGGVIATGLYLLINQHYSDPRSWNGALAFALLVFPGALGLVIGGVSGVTK